MKVLYVTTIGITMNFFKPFIKRLLDEGHTVEIATNEKLHPVADCYKEWGCRVHQIDTSRSPLSKGNLTAIRQLQKIAEEGKYDIVHCHTPVAAMCTRFACRAVRKKGTKVLYTAHGFHFYKGAPLKNWLIFYPVEKVCSYLTDVLITINREDFAFARKKMKAKQIVYVPGVGIELDKIVSCAGERDAKRAELGIPEGKKLLLSVGELNANKNHEVIIRAIAQQDVCYVIAGEGELHGHLQNLIDELGLSQRVKLLGYRTDIGALCAAADMFVFPSYREGLPVSLMEAMTAGLPCVVSNIRGSADLIAQGEGGYLRAPGDAEGFAKDIAVLVRDDALCERMAQHNRHTVTQFGTDAVLAQMTELYHAQVKK